MDRKILIKRMVKSGWKLLKSDIAFDLYIHENSGEMIQIPKSETIDGPWLNIILKRININEGV